MQSGDNMEFHEFLQYFIYVALGVSGWFMKTLWNAVEELKDDLYTLKENLGKNYMPRDEVRDLYEQILRSIEGLHSELKAHEIREFAWHKETVRELTK